MPKNIDYEQLAEKYRQTVISKNKDIKSLEEQIADLEAKNAQLSKENQKVLAQENRWKTQIRELSAEVMKIHEYSHYDIKENMLIAAAEYLKIAKNSNQDTSAFELILRAGGATIKEDRVVFEGNHGHKTIVVF